MRLGTGGIPTEPGLIGNNRGMQAINAIRMGGFDVLPLVEGGKGVAVSNGTTAGHWALGGGIGTLSAVQADSDDDQGKPIPQVYHARTRRERHEELISYAVKGALAQARKAFDITGGKGRIHANILWEMGGAESGSSPERSSNRPRD